MLLRLVLVPLIVALIAMVGRYRGPKAAGMLSGFPVIAGPILYFIYLDQGLPFAQVSATAAIASAVALSSFCFVYAWLSLKWKWYAAILPAWLAYLVLALAIGRLEPRPVIFFVGAIAVVSLQIYFAPRNTQIIRSVPASTMEIVCRMLCAGVLVFLVTTLARAIGPAYSGAFAAFPIASTVIAVFSHRNHSAYHAIESLRSLKFGLISFALFFLVLAIATDCLPFSAAFALAALAALLIQVAILYAKTRFAARDKAVANAAATGA